MEPLKNKPPHVAENRILVEQLRLIYANMTSSILPMYPAILLLVWTLFNERNRVALLSWAAVVTATNTYSILNARFRLSRSLEVANAPQLLRKLWVSVAIGGASWGALAFDALGNTTPVGDIMVISVLAGILGGAVGLLSPVLSVFIAFSVPLVGVTVVKLLLLDDPAYNAFGFISLMYIGTLIMQTRNAGLAVKGAIELRFENIELLDQTALARREADEANAAKSKFLAAASHDLRQPIHAQGLFLDVLSRTELTTQQRELVTCISAASSSSADMLNTLLDFSRIEAGVVQPQIQSFRVQHLLNKIEREFEPQADAKGLAYRSRETALVVQSDPALVELILRNLVSNAIRYTDSGGLLVVCRQKGGSAMLEVWDTGIGIAPAQQGEVFKEFHQLGNPERDRRKGLGLGLAIAQGLAKALSQTLLHSLSLRSQAQRGSVFKLQLPIAANPLEDTFLKTPSQLPDKLRLNARVLVIDDDETVRAAMVHLLRDWGCTGEAAESIDEALVIARKQPLDLVICDYRLRGQSTGLQAIAALRQLMGNDFPVMLITGDTAPERLREAVASGITLLHKPITPHLLHRALVDTLQLQT